MTTRSKHGGWLPLRISTPTRLDRRCGNPSSTGLVLPPSGHGVASDSVGVTVGRGVAGGVVGGVDSRGVADGDASPGSATAQAESESAGATTRATMAATIPNQLARSGRCRDALRVLSGMNAESRQRTSPFRPKVQHVCAYAPPCTAGGRTEGVGAGLSTAPSSANASLAATGRRRTKKLATANLTRSPSPQALSTWWCMARVAFDDHRRDVAAWACAKQPWPDVDHIPSTRAPVRTSLRESDQG